MKDYARTYCELRAALSVQIAVLKTEKGRLYILESGGDRNEAEIAETQEKVAEAARLVASAKRHLFRLELELQKLSCELDDVELKVFCLHYIKGFNLKKIAKKLYFSYSRVKQIHGQIRDKTGG